MLDFSQVAGQIPAFTADQMRALPQRQAAHDLANTRLHTTAPTWHTTQVKISTSKTSWLLADWFEPPDAVYPAPPCPLPCAVFAADGSQIVSDRHDPVALLLINIGTIALHYGAPSHARMTTCPILSHPDDDLLDEFAGEQAAIVPRRLAVYRQLAEFRALAEMCQNADNDTPAVALSDGTLILWTLETEPETFRRKCLNAFADVLEVARQKRVPLVGYISQPQSRDVVNALRIHACTYPHAHCETHCKSAFKPKPEYVAPPCGGTERVLDADLFRARLQPGERSAVFGSRSKILQQCDAHNAIRFFYLHTGVEIARVEIPAWVAEDAALLERAHAVCFDQAQKGLGYPVALTEAHELAVVRGPEKAAFEQILERSFIRAGASLHTTQKALSKRTRRV